MQTPTWPLPPSEVIISDPVAFEEKRRKIVGAGARHLQIIADFDRTLSTAYLKNGERGMSTYGVVESSEHLSANYKAKMQALFNTYYPIEVDPAIPKAEKVKKMEEWWGYANEAMVNEKASISLIPEAVAKASLDLRDGVHDLVETCEKQQIPLLIFSAGITDVIDEIVKQRLALGRNLESVHVISNKLNTDDAGIIIGFQGSVIHVLNKNEQSVDNHPLWFDKAALRKNVILLGDSPGDVGMSDGLKDVDVIIRVGFLNEHVATKLDDYKSLFDIVITNDGPVTWVNDLLASILATGL